MKRRARQLVLILIAASALVLSGCSDRKTQKLQQQVDTLTKQVDTLTQRSDAFTKQAQDLQLGLNSLSNGVQHFALEVCKSGLLSSTNSDAYFIYFLPAPDNRVDYLALTGSIYVPFLDGEIKALGREKARGHPDAELDTSHGAYAPIDNLGGVGTFFIAFEDAQPYLDGYKVRLKIGNPSTATYEGFQLHLTWGRAEVPEPIAIAAHSAIWAIREEDAQRTLSQLSITLPPTNASHVEWTDFYRKCHKAREAWQKSLRSKTVDLDDELKAGAWNIVEVVLSPAKSDELAYLNVGWMQATKLSLRNDSPTR
jgi:outer membrane murein-binding lipoprotein Lpp